MSDIGELLKKIRGKDSLRVAAEKTGLSHGYISIIEKGIDPRTKSPIKPSPESLKAYAGGYRYPYNILMKVAGYIDDVKDLPIDTIINDQARNDVLEAYNRLPQSKKELVDDMIKALLDERK